MDDDKSYLNFLNAEQIRSLLRSTHRMWIPARNSDSSIVGIPYHMLYIAEV